MFKEVNFCLQGLIDSFLQSGNLVDNNLFKEYLKINEYRLSDYDRAVLQIIKSMEQNNETKRISNT